MEARANVFQRNKLPAAAGWTVGGLWNEWKWWVIAPAIIFAWVSAVGKERVGDDLKDGHVPASDRGPDGHWGYIWDHKDVRLRRISGRDFPGLNHESFISWDDHISRDTFF